jgi:predicted RNA-binding protein with PIN domain
MTAREKAIELYNKMLQWQDTADIYIERNIISTSAKYSALIAVDEILEQHKKITVSHIVSAYKTIQDFNENLTNVQNELDSYVLQNYGYWQEVKQEIQGL